MAPHKKNHPDQDRRSWVCNRTRWVQPSVLALAIILAGAGCAPVGPDYQQIAPPAPAKWNTELDQGLSAVRTDPETLAHWWTVLDDPLLTSLEERAVTENLTLKVAESRIREARALRGISQAGLWPDLIGSAAATWRRASKNDSGTRRDNDLYTVGFDAGWELDVFGGRRRAVEAAQADLEASQEDLRDALVTLQAEVALNYVDFRAGQARLAVAEANIAAQRQTYELNLSRYQAGLIDELAMQQSLYNLEHSRSQIPVLEIGLAAAGNRLAILLGKTPGTLEKELAERRPVPVPPLVVAVGVPADTLRHRPDIRRAERILAARTARIGEATADLYPKFRLLGSIGLESATSSELLDWDSRTWGFGPLATWRLFDAGAIRQNIEVQTQRHEQALIQYEAAILNALEEVENALISFVKEQRRRDSLIKATEAARRADLLARDQYKAGLVDFSNVLDAQRSLLSFEDELALSEGSVTTDLLRLYKALGGGWKTMAAGLGKGETD